MIAVANQPTKGENGLYSKQAILDTFTGLDIDLRPAGIWDYDTTSQKKISVDPKRVDNASWSRYPKDNMFRFNLKDTNYLVVDADGISLQELEDRLPSLSKTFSTTTTREGKRHYYVVAPEGSSFNRSRAVRVDGPDSFDVFTTGVVFEGHIFNLNQNYHINNSVEPVAVTPDEFNYLNGLLKQSNTSQAFKDSPRISNYKMARLVKQYIADPQELKQTDLNTLVRMLSNQEYLDTIPKYTKVLRFAPLGHMVINTIAFILTYNGAIDHLERDEFIDRLLVDAYGVDPNSIRTKQHLEQSIYTTLPRYEKLADEQKLYPLQDLLHQTKLDENYAVVKTKIRGSYWFAEINPHTLKLRLSGKNDDPFFNDQTLFTIYKEHIDKSYDLNDLKKSIPEVKIVEHALRETVFMDHENDIECLNIAPKTIYQEQAVATEDKPENVVTRIIHSYCGEEHEGLYYQWLAHQMFNHRKVPQMIPVFVAPKEDSGGSGKTALGAHIPSRLIATSITTTTTNMLSGWGDATAGNSLIMLNDMERSKDWLKVYAKLRDESTGGVRKQGNMKYGGFVETTSSAGFSVSANFLPAFEEHDRRFWVVQPQHVEGKTPKLDSDDQEAIYEMFEESGLDEYHIELQELANYLLFLYTQRKRDYKHELTRYAPRTSYLLECINIDKTHSQELLIAMGRGPEALEEIVDQHMVHDAVEIYKFMIFQYDQSNDYVSLPWKVLADLLNCIQNGEGSHNKPASVAAALDISRAKMVNTGQANHRFKDAKLLEQQGIDTKFAEYSTSSHYKVEMKPEVMSKYVEYVDKYFKELQIDDINLNGEG